MYAAANTKNGTPKWKIHHRETRNQSQLFVMRKDLSQLKEFLNHKITEKMIEEKKHKIKNNENQVKIREKFKQRISAKTISIKKYTKRSVQYKQNKQSTENAGDSTATY